VEEGGEMETDKKPPEKSTLLDTEPDMALIDEIWEEELARQREEDRAIEEILESDEAQGA